MLDMKCLRKCPHCDNAIVIELGATIQKPSELANKAFKKEEHKTHMRKKPVTEADRVILTNRDIQKKMDKKFSAIISRAMKKLK